MEVLSLKAGKTGRTEVDTAFLGDKVRTRTLKNAVIMYEANKRVGTHNTLTRAEVTARRSRSSSRSTPAARASAIPRFRSAAAAASPTARTRATTRTRCRARR